MNLIQIAKAAEGGVVGCSGADCTVCSIMETVSSAYNVLTGLSFAVAVLFLALAGLVYIFGTGRKSYFLKAKNFARNAILGFVFVLVGWIAIHAVLYSTGYKNAGNWWKFQCDTTASTQSVSLNTVNSYSDLADFVASGATQGRIKNPISDAVFANVIKNLQAGEKLIFYLPAKKSGDQEETLIPFLAGYKTSTGEFKLDDNQTKIIQNLLTSFSSSEKGTSGNSFENALALLTKSGDFFSPEQTTNLVNALFKSLFGIDTTSMSWNEKYAAAKKGISDFQSTSSATSDNGALSKAVNNMIDTALKEADSVVVKKTTEDSTSKDSSSGDRSEGYDPSKWKNTQTQNQQNSQSQQAQNKPGSTDDWSKIIDQNKKDADKNKDNSKDTSLCDDDWAPGDGTKMAILKGLRRLYKRDRLRYEMLFRFVDTVGDKPGGGECNDCGKIKVDHSAVIVDVAHILVHEGTHSGQFCLKLMGPYEAQGVGEKQPGRGKIEAIACANAMGAVEKNKGHKNMDEFNKGVNGEPIENQPKVTLGAGSGQGGTGQIRGNLARFWTQVNPRGDLDDGMLSGLYQFMTKYPITQGLPQSYYPAGKNHYGICEGQPKYLTLQDPEEEVVKKIVTSKEKCKSSPPKDVLPPCKAGDKPEPLPQIEACKGAPEMQIQ